MSAPPPIPPGLWYSLRAFLEGRRTGSVTLHVHEGHVRSLVLAEHVRADEAAAEGTP
jgi:hypothetical protein